MTTSTLSRLLLGLSVVTSLALGIIVINTSPDDDGALDASVALGDAAGASPSSSASDASTDPMDDHQTGMLSLPPGSPEIPPDPEVEKVTGSAKKETTTSEPESKPDDPTTTSPVAPATTKPEGRSLSGPVVVGGESGVVVAGLVISNPDGPCVRISGSVDVVV
ncbi:MAG: hypothetical protein ACRDU9_03695, partial [Acidimicrobiia bacterium]